MIPAYTWSLPDTGSGSCPSSWPERPAVPPTADEQRPLKETAYRRWRKTPDGRRAWRWIDTIASISAEDSRTRRIGVKRIVEDCRDTLKVSINNSWTAYIARDLVDADPERFGPLIKLRALGAGRSRGAALR